MAQIEIFARTEVGCVREHNEDDCLETCVAASCGDGFVRAGVEECDDANADDTDECANDCTVNGAGTGSSGGLDDTGGGTESEGSTTGGTTADDDTGTGTEGDGGTAGSVDGGSCSCRSGGDPWRPLGLLLLVLGVLRRRS